MFDDDWDNEGSWADPSDEGEWGAPSRSEQEMMGEVPDTSNPLLTPQADAQIHSPPLQQASQPPAIAPAQAHAPSLVGRFDAHGRPVACCKMVMKNGQPVQVSPWKQPSADEYNALMYQSKKVVVQGGVAANDVSTATNAASTNQMVPLGAAPSKWGTAKKVAAVAVVGAGVWWGYKKFAGE